MGLLQVIFDYYNEEAPESINSEPLIVEEKEELIDKNDPNTQRAIPPGRVSKNEDTDNGFANLGLDIDFAKPEFAMELIPHIRRLSKTNEDVGAVYNDLIQLTNTGHKIKFDQSLPPEQVAKMRKHLSDKSKNWGSGVAGIDGLVNKFIGQIWIAGALSTEAVPNKFLTGIDNVVLVNPENIKFKYNKALTRYEAYQKVKNTIALTYGENVIKLNPNTYTYYGILGDTDSPYGIPPFLTALESLATQKNMKENIQHIMRMLGLMGYLEVKVDKPMMEAGEKKSAYIQRLNGLLQRTKANVLAGFREGIAVGFQEDHEFEFHATTQSMSGVSEVYNANEVQVANGLKTTPNFIGQKSGGAESGMSIVFTKMLSQLGNTQRLAGANLEKIYILELKLAGFNIKNNQISVEFKPSTITDDLKLWQAKEIKQRVLHNLRIDGIIDQNQYAEEMNYDEPAAAEPVVPFDEQTGGGGSDPESEEKREKDKDTSDRRNRDKNKPQPKRKDSSTKPS